MEIVRSYLVRPFPLTVKSSVVKCMKYENSPSKSLIFFNITFIDADVSERCILKTFKAHGNKKV
jgi:hypothetical protein